jgi:hypothetical protein
MTNLRGCQTQHPIHTATQLATTKKQSTKSPRPLLNANTLAEPHLDPSCRPSPPYRRRPQATHTGNPLHDIIIPITGDADPFIPFANSVIDETTGESYEYKQLMTLPQYREKWLRSSSNEFGRLAQGIRDVAGTDTITFIAKTDVPVGRSVTYAQFVATLRPQKAEQEHTRLTVGGNLIDYPGDVSTRTAGLTTAKILWNRPRPPNIPIQK